MGLIKSVGILALVVIVAVAAAFGISSLLHSSHSHSVTPAQAEHFVLADLQQASPTDTNISILNVSPSPVSSGSWRVTVSVVYNATTPCPTFLVNEYDYPAVTLVPSVEDVYTSNCTIYGLANAPSYVISAPPVAITRSYDLHNQSVLNFVTSHINTVVVHAMLYNSIAANSTPLGIPFNDTWIINYSAPGAGALYALMNESGTRILGTYATNSPA